MIVNKRSFRYLIVETNYNETKPQSKAYFLETSKKHTTTELFERVYGEKIEKEAIKSLQIDEARNLVFAYDYLEEHTIVFKTELINGYEKEKIYEIEVKAVKSLWG